MVERDALLLLSPREEKRRGYPQGQKKQRPEGGRKNGGEKQGGGGYRASTRYQASTVIGGDSRKGSWKHRGKGLCGWLPAPLRGSGLSQGANPSAFFCYSPPSKTG